MRFIYSALLLLPLSSVLLAATPPPAGTTSPTPATITQLVMRDYRITISTGGQGAAQYDVFTQSGHPLDSDLNLEQLQAKYPAIYDSLHPAVASESARTEDMLIMMENYDWSERIEPVGF